MLSIRMPRGDIRSFKIAIKDPQGEITEITFDDIYFTVKRVFLAEEFRFQKRYSDGSITKDSEGYYHFRILPEDTNGLPFGDYDFDIEIVKNGAIKQTTVGVLSLTKEVTFASNEG